MSEQRREAESLKAQLCSAGEALVTANQKATAELNAVLVEQKERAAEERTILLSQITSLVQGYGDTQDKRIEAKVASVQEQITQSNAVYKRQEETYSTAMNAWSEQEQLLVHDMVKARENVKAKVKKDWTVSWCQPIDVYIC